MKEQLSAHTSEVKLESFFTKVLSVIGRTTDLQLASLMQKGHHTIAVAESLTAGMVCSRLANVARSSEYFLGGIVCYHNRIKVVEVGVPAALISKHGPVSKEVAVSMAENIRKKFKTEIGLSTTGLAGPKNEEGLHPGLVYIALATHQGCEFKEIHLQGTRNEIRRKAAQACLGLLWLHLGGDEVVQNAAKAS
ncbi:MAG: CinA family protein [Candidatus Margulisbacteria bacterium]|nr:CinA family protein [Candidatus Margulisiibacteriota bacterium]MBU1021896.1 CinA family protein [Candidatus Margulisiibacteriota bacterium]MBU1728534.1 CinA family protein [Candidatus Margulisiibacteriota bacterium]MBU1954681.1 CinA family protein [Candidatus Margulisiibacteriota bacterium]